MWGFSTIERHLIRLISSRPNNFCYVPVYQMCFVYNRIASKSDMSIPFTKYVRTPVALKLLFIL